MNHSLQNIYSEAHEQNLSITDSDDVNTMKICLESCDIYHKKPPRNDAAPIHNSPSLD